MARAAGGVTGHPGGDVRQPGLHPAGAHRYRLDQSFAVTLTDSAPAISPLTLRATDGSGIIQLGGRVPGTSEGSLALRILGMDLHDVYGVLQRDTAAVGGLVGLDVRMGGTARRPPSEEPPH